MGIVIVAALYGLAALIYSPVLVKKHLLAFIGAVIFITIAEIYIKKSKPIVDKFCQELEGICNDKTITEE